MIETKSQFPENLSNDKLLARLIGKKRKKTPITNIRSKRGNITQTATC